MYGHQDLAEAKGVAAAAPMGINQIPGELHAMARKLDNLRSDLEQQ